MEKTKMLYRLLAVISLMPSATVFAGPGSRSPIAALSENGQVLATCEMTFDGSDETQPRKVTSSTFSVNIQPIREVNAGLRVNGPNTYWDYQPLLTTWRVHLPSAQFPAIVGCPYMLVTNDGEYLLLLQSYAVQKAILLFRRRDHPGQPSDGSYNVGVLIREIPVDEVDPLPSSALGRMMTDHSPQWYSKGIFSFSKDNRTLSYSKVSGSIEIDLVTGRVRQVAVSGAKP